jgi:hypothetical protein
MDKKLIQQLLDDDETRLEIAIAIGHAVDANDDANDDGSLYGDLMINALNELNDRLVEGDMVTIEVSEYMWVRGKYVGTRNDGQVRVFPAFGKPYTGKRVDFVVKSEEGEADV